MIKKRVAQGVSNQDSTIQRLSRTHTSSCSIARRLHPGLLRFASISDLLVSSYSGYIATERHFQQNSEQTDSSNVMLVSSNI